MHHYSDDDLAVSMAQGCKKSLAVLMDRHWKWVHSMMKAYVHDDQSAEELAQDAFHRIYRKAGMYKAGSNFPAWLRQIASNIAKSYLSRKRPMTLLAFDRLPDDIAKDERFDPANALQSDLLQQEMRNAMADMQFFEPCDQLLPTYNALISAAKANHPDEPFLQALPELSDVGEKGVNQLKILLSQLRIVMDSLLTNGDST